MLSLTALLASLPPASLAETDLARFAAQAIGRRAKAELPGLAALFGEETLRGYPPRLGAILQALVETVIQVGLDPHELDARTVDGLLGGSVFLGRLGDKAHGDKLKVSLTDADPMVRRYAAEALAKLDYKAAVPDLLMALEANVAGHYVVRAVRVLTGEDFGFDPDAPLLHRQEAIEKGFVWVTAHPVQ